MRNVRKTITKKLDKSFQLKTLTGPYNITKKSQ